jgi:hypothetical protein
VKIEELDILKVFITMESPVDMPTLDLSDLTNLPDELDFVDQVATVSTNGQQPSLADIVPEIPSEAIFRHDQLHKLSNNPIFQELQSTLRSECDVQDSAPSALLASTGHVTAVPVTVRVSQINLRFLRLSSCSQVKANAFQLQSFYVQKSAELESARWTALSTITSNAWLTNTTNALYDQQHHGLLDRVEQSLILLEKRLMEPPVVRTSASCKITSTAISVMTIWYEQHCEHPYPNRDDLRSMAKTCDLSVEQVRKWFYNRRQRLGNVKSIGQITQYRKRSRMEYHDDILLEGAKFSRYEC